MATELSCPKDNQGVKRAACEEVSRTGVPEDQHVERTLEQSNPI